jgi:hypothetical protein
MEVIFRHGSGRPRGEWISFLGQVLVGLPMVSDSSLFSLGRKRRRCSSHSPATQHPPPLAKPSTLFPTMTQTPTSCSSSARRAHVCTRKVGSEEQVLGKFRVLVLVSGRWCSYCVVVLSATTINAIKRSNSDVYHQFYDPVLGFSKRGQKRGHIFLCKK